MRWYGVFGAMIIAGMAVGWFYFPRSSVWHLVITAAGIGALLVLGRLTRRPSGKP